MARADSKVFPDRSSPDRISPARKEAFAILLALERGRGHSDDLLRARPVSRLSPQDKNLATALVLGVLRWQIALDARVRPLLKRPGAKLDAEVLVALRMGAFQLLMLDRVPAHAAIDESVELVREAGHKFASGMVNAVLRRLAVAGGVLAEAREAYPAWLVERWIGFFGAETAQAICAHGVAEPGPHARVADAATEEELARDGVLLGLGGFLTASRVVRSGDVVPTAAFREGRVRIQDEGSQLVAEIAGKGAKVLDACAAPGGKTLILAERNPAARVVACEVNAARFGALRKRLAPLGERVECREIDAALIAETQAFDLVLADVPCSGTGTLGRNPEIRHKLTREEFARQAERQKAILTAALRAAKSGARVVYSTCSLEPEEDERVVEAVLAENPRVRVGSLAARIERMRVDGIVTAEGAEKLARCVTPEGYLRLFPGVFGTDGFFIALLQV